MNRIRTGCKINLGLRITGKRPDGFHDISTLFYPLRWPSDDIIVDSSSTRGIRIECDSCLIPPENNIIKAVWDAYPERPVGLSVKLIKRIPTGAGLGGGSADAAAFLKWLNSFARKPLGMERLDEIAVSVGADVPFFLRNVPCAAEGIGEKLEPVPVTLPGAYLLLVWPGIHVATAWAFETWDRDCCLTNHYSEARNPNSADIDLSNDLEAPVFSRWPQLANLKDALLALGASGAAMSGSGSAVYGVFANFSVARAALTALRRAWPRIFFLKLDHSGM